MTDNDPFPPGNMTLTPSRLSIVEKRWLGNQIAQKCSSGRALAKRFGVSRRCLRNYADHIKSGRKFHVSAGRPAIFDEKSMKEIELFTCCEPPSPSRLDIVDKFFEERRKTTSRRNGKTTSRRNAIEVEDNEDDSDSVEDEERRKTTSRRNVMEVEDNEDDSDSVEDDFVVAKISRSSIKRYLKRFRVDSYESDEESSCVVGVDDDYDDDEDYEDGYWDDDV